MAEKILVVLLHGIGDSLMAMPAVHALKQKYPGCSLSVMTIQQPVFQELWKYNNDVNEVIFSSLSHNPRYGSPFFWLGDYLTIRRDIRRVVKTYGFTQVHFVKMFLMPAKIYSFLRLPRYEEHKTLKVAHELGVELDTLRYHLKYGEDDRTWAELFLHGRKLDPDILVGLHVSGSHPSKSLPADAVAEVAKMLKSLGYQTVLFHSRASYERDQHQIPAGVEVCVADHLLHVAALIDACQFLICVDSGVGHIAAALNKKLLNIHSKEVWMKNSLALGDFVTPYLYQNNIEDLLNALSSFFQQRS